MGSAGRSCRRGPKKRRRNRIKGWLNTRAAERMTPEQIARADPQGEIAGWLETIARMAGPSG
jgi:hypothetical protein